MAKYSYELKRKIVEEYLSGKTSYLVLEDKYQIDYSQIRRWVNNYKHFGDEGLMRSRNKRSYSVEFKLEAITRYETSECSYQQLALELGLTNPSIIANWRRQYREEGVEGLRSHKRGRPVTNPEAEKPGMGGKQKESSATSSGHGPSNSYLWQKIQEVQLLQRHRRQNKEKPNQSTLQHLHPLPKNYH